MAKQYGEHFIVELAEACGFSPNDVMEFSLHRSRTGELTATATLLINDVMEQKMLSMIQRHKLNPKPIEETDG